MVVAYIGWRPGKVLLRRLPGTSLVVLSATLAIAAVLFYTFGLGYATLETGTSLGDDPAGIGRRAPRLAWHRPPVALLFPVVASLMPLLARGRRSALLLRSLAALGLLGFVVLGAFSVGLLFLPSTVLMVVAALRWHKSIR